MKNPSSCTSCGASLTFDTKTRRLYCEHCGSSFNIPTKKTNTILVHKYSPEFTLQANTSALNTFICNTCGTSHTVQDGKVSTRCPSCGSTNITASANKLFYPDGIIPFKLSKAEAQQIFVKWLKKRKFAPKGLVNLAKQGKITQMYVPVYNFNGVCHTAYTAIVKKVHTDKASDAMFSTSYTLRDIDLTQINNVIFSANTKVDSEVINKITTFDQGKIVPYSSEYLFGYYGGETNINVHKCYSDLNYISGKDGEAKIRSKLKSKYDDIDSLQTNSRLRDVTFNYTYVPVFVNHYTYGKKDYHCYIGGESGKVAGKSPKSAAKVAAVTLGVLGVLAVGILLLAKFVF